MRQLKVAEKENRLERKVQSIINTYARDYDKINVESFLKDLFEHGCISGMVNELIYYQDTCKWYNKFKTEINNLLKETLENTGLSIDELFRDKWDENDPLIMDDFNQNLLAWFSFEETARILTDRAEIEI